MRSSTLSIAIAVALAATLSASGQSSANMPAITFNPTPVAPPTPAAGNDAKPLTATSAFVDAPTSIFPTIDRLTRLDMVDYFNSGSQKPSRNAFKGDCRITSASDKQITIETSEVSTVELSILTSAKNDTVIMAITTLKTPIPDSDIKFYTSNWGKIEKTMFNMPGLKEWSLPAASKRMKDLENAVPFILARLSYDPATQTMTATNNTREYLPEEDATWVGELLRDNLHYRWTGKHMERIKE